MVSQLPLLEISWPMKNSRKLRVHSDENVRRRYPAGGPVVSLGGWVTAVIAGSWVTGQCVLYPG